MQQPVYLLGMMGCGKSRVGELVARACGRQFIDLDVEIVAREGQSIAELFAPGEENFRAAERRAALHIADEQARATSVVALGGGAYLDVKIRDAANRGHAVYLQADPRHLLARLDATARARRPLFCGGGGLFDPAHELRFMNLYAQRHPVYLQAAYRVDAMAPPTKVAAKILETLKLEPV